MDQRILDELNKYSLPIDSMEFPNFFKAVIYGDFGVGKTTWSSQFGKTIFLAADQGIRSVKNHPELATNVKVVTYQGPKHWKVMCDAISEQVPGYECDTYVIDTMSHIQEDYVLKLVNTSKYTDGKQRPRVVYNDPKEAIDGDPMELAGPPDYNRAKAFFTPGILKLVKAPVNVIFIAHEREPGWMEKADKTKTEEEKALRPSVTESLFKVMAREANLVGHMDTTTIGNKTRRTIQFVRTRSIIGKSGIKELSAQEKYPASEAASILNEWRQR